MFLKPPWKNNLATKSWSTVNFLYHHVFSIVASCLGDFRDSKVLEVKYEIGHETHDKTQHHFMNIFIT
jgi:hypothetical protein